MEYYTDTEYFKDPIRTYRHSELKKFLDERILKYVGVLSWIVY